MLGPSFYRGSLRGLLGTARFCDAFSAFPFHPSISNFPPLQPGSSHRHQASLLQSPGRNYQVFPPASWPVTRPYILELQSSRRWSWNHSGHLCPSFDLELSFAWHSNRHGRVEYKSHLIFSLLPGEHQTHSFVYSYRFTFVRYPLRSSHQAMLGP